MKKITRSMISDFILGVVLMLLTLFAFFLFSVLETPETVFMICGPICGSLHQRFRSPSLPLMSRASPTSSRWPWPRAHIASMVELCNPTRSKSHRSGHHLPMTSIRDSLRRNLIRFAEGGARAGRAGRRRRETNPASPKKSAVQQAFLPRQGWKIFYRRQESGKGSTTTRFWPMRDCRR